MNTFFYFLLPWHPPVHQFSVNEWQTNQSVLSQWVTNQLISAQSTSDKPTYQSHIYNRQCQHSGATSTVQSLVVKFLICLINIFLKLWYYFHIAPSLYVTSSEQNLDTDWKGLFGTINYLWLPLETIVLLVTSV